MLFFFFFFFLAYHAGLPLSGKKNFFFGVLFMENVLQLLCLHKTLLVASQKDQSIGFMKEEKISEL